MNIFVPEAYYEGFVINGYSLNTAPVFMPNTVGGYMPGELDEPGYNKFGPKKPNSIFRALLHGYVVAAPAIRGRTQKNTQDVYTGKAPACIVDYKAAVRYLHYFSEELPGDENKIITNGTSAGGALSSLMGAAGNHPDYLPYLNELGAAPAGDEIFAASCYCPITNLDHADMAYEWEFSGVYDYHRMHMKLDEGGRPDFTPEDGQMSDLQVKVSGELASRFPAYINSLGLKDVDFAGYVRDITRMKTAPAFDSLTMNSPENDLFGTSEGKCRHFTAYSLENSLAGGSLAEEKVIKMLNSMYYIGDEQADTVRFWRIRHGECDRDTSLAVSAILTAKLKEAGCQVDYHSPWNVPHAGDYDLEELFGWIDGICR